LASYPTIFILRSLGNIGSLDFREAEQLKLLEEFVPYYREMPHQPSKWEGLRYYFENATHSYSDANLLHCMIVFLRPNRIIEVGSGFSSCMVLDTNDLKRAMWTPSL
jgi:hypothetical protein